MIVLTCNLDTIKDPHNYQVCVFQHIWLYGLKMKILISTYSCMANFSWSR